MEGPRLRNPRDRGRRRAGPGWRVTVVAVVVLAAAMGLTAAQGHAAAAERAGSPRPAWFQRFPLPAGSAPWSLAVAPDGTVWVTLTGSRQLGALDPATGRWRFVALPAAVRQPARLAAGPDGSLWLTDNDFGQDPPAVLYRYRPGPKQGSPAQDGEGSRWQSYPLPFAGASAVLATRDAVWIVQFQGNRLGRLDPVTGRVTTYTLPLPDDPWPSSWDLAMDDAGRLWTVSPRTGTVYRFDPERETWASFALPPDVAGPAGLAVTPDGGGVWVTEHGGRIIGRLDVATRAWVPLLTPPAPPTEEIQATRPNDLEWDEQGRLWVALHTGNALVRIDPTSTTLELFPLPAAEPKAWVQWLARGPDGAIWFAAYGRDYVGRVDPAAQPLVQLAATVETAPLAPGASAAVRLALVRPGGAADEGVDWQVADLPRGWDVQWEERGPAAARLRLEAPPGAEAGVYPVVAAAKLDGGRVVTRTVRLQVRPATALPWATVAGFVAQVGALTVGWLGVLAGVQTQRRQGRDGPSPGQDGATGSGGP